MPQPQKKKRFKGIKSLFDDTNYKDDLLFCEATNKPYIIEESNYTLKITSAFLNRYYLQNVRSPFCFAVGKMIVKDIEATGLTAPEINKSDLKYFDFNVPDKLKKGLTIKNIYNIDIKSAYAKVLFNHSLITPRTFKFMANLEKPDRLAAVGMLAAHKEIFEVIGRETINSYSEICEHQNWFYFCVTRTNEIMNKVRELLGNSFLHFWVDGIFFDNPKHIKKVENYLTSIGYDYSYNECHNYTYFEDNKGERVSYFVDGKEKILFLPRKNNEMIKFLIKFLSLHDEQ